jgi:hypothetical protein
MASWRIPSRSMSWVALTALLLGATAARAMAASPAGRDDPLAGAIANGARRDTPAQGERQGSKLLVNGVARRAGWLWRGPEGSAPAELWLPLEVLQDQLGFSSRTNAQGALDLEWYGRGLIVPPARQRSLADEVAVEVAGVLAAVGMKAEVRGEVLSLELPPPALLRVRSSSQPGVRRVVLDLDGPTAVGSDGNGLRLDLRSAAALQGQLASLGLAPRQGTNTLTLVARPRKLFTLGDPPRVVIDLPAASGKGKEPAAAPLDPRLQALLGKELRWDRSVQQVGGRRILLNAVRFDPRAASLELRPLSHPQTMEGLSSLVGLARHYNALVAINGGFFNRVRRLPLGALKEQGRWRSGPILNRGVVAWEPRSLPRFGRLSLQEWVSDGSGRRWPVEFVNSGYVKRGLSRYTADWGRVYRALSGAESAVLVRQGAVQQRLDQARLAAGVRLGPGDVLLVGRAGMVPPWREGERLDLESRPSSELGQASNVLGGGPLLLLNGQRVLNGTAEGFSPSFLSQGAPRTVIGSDGRSLWLVTMEGMGDAGPTLLEAAVALQRLGLRDALNLDGGSSTGLVMGGRQTVKGRGVAGSVHNALGLVPVLAGEVSRGR